MSGKKPITVIIPTRGERLANLISATFSFHARIQYFVWFDETEEEFSHKRRWVEFIFANRSNITWGVGRIGLIDAQNKGVEFSGDSYIHYLHGHDFLGLGIIELAEYLDENPDVAFAYGNQQCKGMDNNLYRAIQYNGDQIYDWNYPRSSLIIRADIVRGLGGYRKTHDFEGIGYNEDYDLLLRMHEAGYHGIAIDTKSPVCYYTVHKGGETDSIARNLDVCNEAFRKLHPKFNGSLTNASFFGY